MVADGAAPSATVAPRMDQVSVVGPDELDFDEYTRLQRESYAEMLTGTGLDAHLRPDFFAWKYGTSAGAARVAVVRSAGSLVAANAMFPMCVSDGTTRTVVWQSCDTATHPSARGRGLFAACLRALHESLPPETVFFGFPNASSLRGFVNLGWTVHADVDTFARPVVAAAADTAAATTTRPLRPRDATVDALADAACREAPAVRKDAAYLARRYLEHPVHRYDALVLDGDGPSAPARGVVVLRLATIQAREVAIVMDVVAGDAAETRRLLGLAAAWGAARGARMAVAMGTTLSAFDALRAGFVRVPGFALPKRQVLMGAANGPAATALWQRRWNVQLGDWDAF